MVEIWDGSWVFGVKQRYGLFGRGVVAAVDEKRVIVFGAVVVGGNEFGVRDEGFQWLAHTPKSDKGFDGKAGKNVGDDVGWEIAAGHGPFGPVPAVASSSTRRRHFLN